MEGLDIKYYGATYQINSLVEEYIGNSEFEKWFKKTIKMDIETVDEYINNLKVKVILQLAKLLPDIESEEYKIILNKFYSKAEKLTTLKDINIKLIRFINDNSQCIWEYNDVVVMSESLDFILTLNKFKGWDVLINNDKCVHYLGFNHFDKTQNILKREYKELRYIFIRKTLLPLKIHGGLGRQLEIVNSIKNIYIDIADEYENVVMEYLEGDEFNKIECYDKHTIINTLLQGKCFNSKSEIILNNKLSKVNIECDKKIGLNGRTNTISSEKYMDAIQTVEVFRDKIFMLIYEQWFSLFELMMIESKETSLIDLVNYNGIRNSKYKNSTLRKIRHLKHVISINTLALITNYTSEFWSELINLISDVEELSNITKFLSDDIENIKFLIDNKLYFIAATHLAQIIERLLRELYFSLEYGAVGFLKSSNLTLGSLLKDDENNSLMKLFSKNEINALNFFLNDREHGENLRNKVAHYTINTTEVSEIDLMFLLDILIFILLKVDYQGIEFER